jgi:hypothetical protein
MHRSPASNAAGLKAHMTHAFKSVRTPVGMLRLVASNTALAAVLWENDDPKRVRLSPLVEDAGHPILCAAERQLVEYFAGRAKRSISRSISQEPRFKSASGLNCSTFRSDRRDPMQRSLWP